MPSSPTVLAPVLFRRTTPTITATGSVRTSEPVVYVGSQADVLIPDMPDLTVIFENGLI